MLLEQSLVGQKARFSGGLAALTAGDYRYAFSPPWDSCCWD